MQPLAFFFGQSQKGPGKFSIFRKVIPHQALRAQKNLAAKLLQQLTSHCNDDLNIINEQGNPMVNLSYLVLLQCKIAIFEIISPALLEILVGMHSPFCPIWRIFLPVYNRPSKRAGDLILKMAILHWQSTKLLELTIGILCSIIILRSSFQ